MTRIMLVPLAACVTSVDESLPYDELPTVTVATEFRLVASPSHPTSYITDELVPAGTRVQVVGTDENAAWLLVLRENVLGWMPSFFSRDNVANLAPAVTFESLAEECTTYLDTTFNLTEEWLSNVEGAVTIIGSVYRSQLTEPFDDATLNLKISGSGMAVDSDYVHTPLTPTSAVVLFGFSIVGLQKRSRIHFNLSNSRDEPLLLQAAFFSNKCSAGADRLPIGKIKVTGAEQDVMAQVSSSTSPQPTDATTPTPK